MTSLNEETAKKVIRQVEFYFSDSNLPRDKFLRSSISVSEDGMMSLALICSFSRMRNHLGIGDARPEDVKEDTVKAVAETLRTSSFLKVSEDGKKIGRASKLLKQEEAIDQLDAKTIAVSPFEIDVKLEDIESLFSQFAKVTSIRLPRHVADKKFFCGTALVEFSTEEDASKVSKESLIYSGAELELKPKKHYDGERAKQIELVDNLRHEKNKNSREATYPKGLIVAFKLKSISAGSPTEQECGHDLASDNIAAAKSDREPDATETANEDSKLQVEEVENDGKPNGENMESSGEKDVEKNSCENGEKTAEGEEKSPDSSMKKDEQSPEKEKSTVTTCENTDFIGREDLKAVLKKFGTVKFVDFKLGEDSGYIRFEEAGAAQKARAAAVLAEGGLVVKNFVAILDPVTGDAEKEYWSLLRDKQEKRLLEFKENQGNQASGRRFNRGKHFRSREFGYSNRRNKVQKIEAA